MAIKFDDFLSKKKEPAQVLDLSRVKVTSKEEFKKYFDKIPEYKIKPEKVLPESIKIRDKDFGLTPSRREGRVPEYSYLDPTPPDMKAVQLADLCPVSIDWKMLTTLRPKTKQEEDMFSRLVQLGKLDLKHQQNLKRSKDADWIRRTKNPRSSIVETRVLSCKECGEDFCDGSVCCKLTYENFFRIQPSTATGVVKGVGLEGGDEGEKGKKKHKRRGRTRTRGPRRRKPRKNSIFNRPASRGCSRDHSKRERHAAVIRAGRSASQDRGRSATRRASVSPAPRAKSAPRIHFKGLSSDDDEPRSTKKRGMTSSSGASHSDFSTQSDSESPPRRVEFAEAAEQGSQSGARTRRPFVRHCTLSDSGEWVDPYTRHPPQTVADRGETTSEGSDSSPSPERHQRLRPAMIQLELELGSSGSKVPRSAPAARTSTAARRLHRQQEVRALVTGLSRIELAFADEEPQEPPARIRRRQRLQRSGRPKTSPMKPPSSTGLQGKALFSKSALP